MRIDVVTLLDILEHLGECSCRISLALQFEQSTLGAHLGAGRHKHLEVGIGEDDGANVATIHYDATFKAHLLLEGNQIFAHE